LDPAGGAYSAPQTRLLVGRGLAAPSPRTHPCYRLFGPQMAKLYWPLCSFLATRTLQTDRQTQTQIAIPHSPAKGRSAVDSIRTSLRALRRSSHSFHWYDATMLDSWKCVSVCVPLSVFVTGFSIILPESRVCTPITQFHLSKSVYTLQPVVQPAGRNVLNIHAINK